ncbi:MAG: gliding motility lipoprotein GldH [Paludibacteraceae bacterium]|nr:gliding motility lipoprotein GldH [Paludibacteraceae bacterium]
MKRNIFLLTAVVITLFSSCRTDVVYNQFYPISSEKWAADSTLRFDYRITDAEAQYTTIVYFRHTERFPYQNMWLFVSDSSRRDTIEFYLADDRGRWLGNKRNGFIEMPVLLDEQRVYPDTGAYFLEIQHGMRDSLLRGVTDVGVEIIKNTINQVN